MQRARAERRLFVGTYTEDTASEGIYVLAFDEDERRLHVVNAGTHAPNPSYLVRAQSAGSPAGAEAGTETKPGGSATSTLYAAHELADRSCLAAYDVAEDGTLCCRGTCSSPADAGTCFATVHPDGRCLYGANYESGSVGLCLLDANGNPCGGLPSIRHAGSGPNCARQSAPHVHSARFVPGTGLLAVVDLGTDVAPETFIQTAKEQNCQVICLSTLLAGTMGVMEEVVKAAEAAGIRDRVKIMVGGAPVTEAFCRRIGADAYTPDAATAAEIAVQLCS